MKKNMGFTLMEIIIVIALMGVLGLILTNILSQVLRGQNKINVVSHVKQNGQLILDKLSNEIRSAEKVICVDKTPSANANDTVVLFRNGNYTRFRFIKPVQEAPGVNGYFRREDFTKDVLPDAVTDIDLCTETEVTRGQVSVVTDMDGNKGVSINYDSSGGVDQPIFEKQSQSGFPDIILIKFRASEGISTSQTAENTVSEGGVLFTTAVSMRGGK